MEGASFLIMTDQKGIKHLLEKRVTSMLQQRSIVKMLGSNYSIQYRKGVENKVADALSRREIDNYKK